MEVNENGISFDINMIANNEMRIALFDAKTMKFDSGDDVVRYLIYKTTGKTLLIKSSEVIDEVKKELKSKILMEKYIIMNEVENQDLMGQLFQAYNKETE